jgi:DNA-directed RNA polymerase subunit M/transcription elongation factor TFIIS
MKTNFCIDMMRLVGMQFLRRAAPPTLGHHMPKSLLVFCPGCNSLMCAKIVKTGPGLKDLVYSCRVCNHDDLQFHELKGEGMLYNRTCFKQYNVGETAMASSVDWTTLKDPTLKVAQQDCPQCCGKEAIVNSHRDSQPSPKDSKHVCHVRLQFSAKEI